VLPWGKRISVFTKKGLKQQANTYTVQSQHTKGGKTFSAAHGETGETTINCSDDIDPSQSQEFAPKKKGTLLAVCWASLGKNLYAGMTYNFCCRCIGKRAKSA
jgi:hypothetical protein